MARDFTTPQLAETDRPVDDETARKVAEQNLASLYVARHATDLDDQRRLFEMLGLVGDEYAYRTGPVSPEFASSSRGERRAS